MIFSVRSILAAGLALIFCMAAVAAPVRMIVDTDMQTDCDDAGALAVLHALADRGEVEILGMMVGTLNPWAAACTDAINTYYGRPDIPLGVLKGAGVNMSSRFTQGVAENFPHDTTSPPPDAVKLYREILAREANGSVVIASLGYMTNLQDLLNSPPDAVSPLTGKQLIAQKVKVWVCMGGNFPDDYLQTQVSANVNFRRDAQAAIDCITNWPGRIEFVGREIGHRMDAGSRLSETPVTNPVREAYRLFFSGTVRDQHCADLATILYAVRGLQHGGTTYWGIEDTGSVEFTHSDSRFRWVDPPDAENQAYITEILSPNVIENEIEELMIQAPGAQAVPQWGRFEKEITNTSTYADPYRDVTLNVTYISPSGATVAFWGYYDGGQTWKIRFMPNAPGTWQYVASFSDGRPGATGSFECTASNGPGTITAYAANPRWFGRKDGSPFLVRSFHAAGLFKFSVDDPSNPNDGERRTAFLDWAQAQGYNTFSAHFFSTRNATDSVGPKLWPLDYSAYRKVELILDDLSERGMVAYAFTGFFPNSGPYPTSPADRTAYIRYCLARFAPYWNIIMNVGGFEVRDYLSDAEIRSLGDEIAGANPFGHLLGAHQRDGNDIFRNDPWCSFVTLQEETTNLSTLSSFLLNNAVSGKPVYGQETLWMGNNLQPNWTLTDLRKQMWVHMMSAVAYNAGDMNGNNESGFGGSLNLTQKVQDRHDVPKMIWDYLESIPYQTLRPRQDLRNNGFMLADAGERYLCYLPTGGTVNISVEAGGSPYAVTWVNARNPNGDQRSGGSTTNGQGLTAPDADDWLVYLTAAGIGGADEPEISVTGNGVGIATGDAMPGSADGTDFGVVDVAGGSVTHVFTIQNTGAAALTIGGVSLTGAHVGDFSVATSPAATVPPGGSTTFSVTFNPSAAGLRSASVSIACNDSNENPFVFAVAGTGGGGAGTIAWFRFDETPGTADPGNPIVNYGSAGALLNLPDTGGPDGRDNVGAGGYGAAGYPGKGTSFDILASGNGAYAGGTAGSATGGGLQTATAVAQSALQGADGAFTYEAMINVAGISDEQTIISHDGGNGSRGFLFRILSGKLSFYNGSTSIEAAIPTAGNHRFLAGQWFHVAVTYSGEAGASGNLRLYWTALGSSGTSANQIGSGSMSADLPGSVSNKLGIGTTTRSPFRLGGGRVDEVRISNAALAASGFATLSGPSDSDGDGLPDDWESAHGLDPGTSNAGTDTDHDGLPDLLEFALDLDPQRPDSAPGASIEADYLTLSIARNPAASQLDFTVEVTGDLATWSSGAEHVTVLENTPTTLRVRDNTPIGEASRRFIRLRVTTRENE